MTPPPPSAATAVATTEAVDPVLIETVDRLLSSTATFEAVEDAEQARWCAPVWDALADAGFPWISIPEEAGGSGGTLADALAVLRSVGSHAAPVPLAETAVLGGWLAATVGAEIPEGPMTVVPEAGALHAADGRVTGASLVAWASSATRIFAVVPSADGPLVVSFAPQACSIAPRVNMAGEPRDLVQVDLALGEVESWPAPAGCDADTLLLRGALTRVVLSAGALGAMSQRTIDYAHERRQFGRPIAGFQAVQQHLVTVAQSAVRAAMAADVAVHAVAGGAGRTGGAGGGAFEVAAARVVADQAAVEGTRAAHQAHGAMGVTREYPLHHLSRRLWAWRHEYGSGRSWRRRLGAAVVQAGPDELYPTITG